jgi:hypothetical protein
MRKAHRRTSRVQLNTLSILLHQMVQDERSTAVVAPLLNILAL